MGQIFLGPKSLITKYVANNSPIVEDSTNLLNDRILELEKQLANIQPIIKEVEVIKYIPQEIIKIEKEYIEKPIDKIVEVVKEVIRIEKEYIEVPIEKIIEIEKEIEKFVDKEIKIIPKWVFGVVAIETLLIIVMIIKLI